VDITRAARDVDYHVKNIVSNGKNCRDRIEIIIGAKHTFGPEASEGRTKKTTVSLTSDDVL
jgi:hypothetical protein